MIYKNDVKNDTCPVILSSKIGCSSTLVHTGSLHWQSSSWEFTMRVHCANSSREFTVRVHCESSL